MPRRVVVAGAGIVGASVAYQLARRGAEVTVAERGQPAEGTTARSFAWINASYAKQPLAYHLLGRLAIGAWHQLDLELGGATGVHWGGSLEWTGEPARVELFRRNVAGHRSWGYRLEDVDGAGIVALEPGVVPGPVAAAVHALDEGHVDPVTAALAMLEAAGRHGARLLMGAGVTAVRRSERRLLGVETTVGPLPADVLVVACGADTARVAALAGLDVPLIDAPGVLAVTSPLPPLIERVILAPVAHIKQLPDGRVVIGDDMTGEAVPDASEERGRALIASAARYVPELAGAGLERVTLGRRPMPADGYPIAGFDERAAGVYVLVTHSAVTLAPLLGQLAANEIVDGASVELLAPYRLARFGSGA